MMQRSGRPVGSRPFFICGDLSEHAQPFGDRLWVCLAVVDLGQESAVLEFIDSEPHAVALNDMSCLSQRARRECAEHFPLGVIEVDRRASNL